MMMDFHPIANVFPLIEGEEFDALRESIRSSGLQEPIVIFENQILDGRNRYRACKEIGLEPELEPYVGSDPTTFVINANLHRRHLTTGQRAMIAAEFIEYPQGQKSLESNDITPPSRIRPDINGDPSLATGKLLGIGKTSVNDARRILRSGSPKDIEAVRSGALSLASVSKKIDSATASPPRKHDPSNKKKIRAEMWKPLKQTLATLTGLPHPSDVAIEMRRINRVPKVITDQLPIALKWIEEFHNEWFSESRTNAE